MISKSVISIVVSLIVSSIIVGGCISHQRNRTNPVKTREYYFAEFEAIKNSIVIDEPGLYKEGDVDEIPRFPGCEQEFGTKEEMKKCSEIQFLKSFYPKLKYPANARGNGIQGLVVFQFIIGKDGYMRDIKIVHDIGGGCGNATLDVLNAIKDHPIPWITGKLNGKAVDVLHISSALFRLEG